MVNLSIIQVHKGLVYDLILDRTKEVANGFYLRLSQLMKVLDRLISNLFDCKHSLFLIRHQMLHVMPTLKIRTSCPNQNCRSMTATRTPTRNPSHSTSNSERISFCVSSFRLPAFCGDSPAFCATSARRRSSHAVAARSRRDFSSAGVSPLASMSLWC